MTDKEDLRIHLAMGAAVAATFLLMKLVLAPELPWGAIALPLGVALIVAAIIRWVLA